MRDLWREGWESENKLQVIFINFCAGFLFWERIEGLHLSMGLAIRISKQPTANQFEKFGESSYILENFIRQMTLGCTNFLFLPLV